MIWGEKKLAISYMYVFKSHNLSIYDSLGSVPVLKVGWPAFVLPAPPVIRVVLLHIEVVDKNLCPDTLHGYLFWVSKSHHSVFGEQ